MIPRESDRLPATAALLLLVTGCALVLWPFLSSLAWAAILTSTVWTAFVRLQRALGGRRVPAACAMTLGVALALLMPVVVVAVALAGNAGDGVRGLRALLADGLPPPPAWLRDLPLGGATLERWWQQYAHDGQRLVADLRRLVPSAQDLALRLGRAVADGVVDIALSVFIAFFLFLHGEALAARITVALERISGPRAARLIDAARGTVAGVVYGVLGTALAQGVLASAGFAIAGVPGAVLLGVATFFLSVVPVGPPIVWGGVAIWLVRQGDPLWALFVAFWGLLVVSTVDNVIKPFIIARGAHLPFLVVFLGVLGGVIAFGVIGVFLGPALLAVGYRLMSEWTSPDGD